MNVLLPQGRFDDAVSQLERARELDPLSLSVQACFGVVDFMRRDYSRAGETFDTLVLQDPGLQFAHYFGGLNQLYGGDVDRATESLQRAMEVGGWSPEVAAAVGWPSWLGARQNAVGRPWTRCERRALVATFHPFVWRCFSRL
jgi:tetratricopeptide (TPR) repeat protein